MICIKNNAKYSKEYIIRQFKYMDKKYIKTFNSFTREDRKSIIKSKYCTDIFNAATTLEAFIRAHYYFLDTHSERRL